MWNSAKFINNVCPYLVNVYLVNVYLVNVYLVNVYLVNVYFFRFRPRSSTKELILDLPQPGISLVGFHSYRRKTADLMFFIK